MMRFKFCVPFVLFIVLLQSVFAQGDQYNFSHLDITNGLSDNQVNSIYKDGKGFMWFGTTSGLSRYDGYKFRVFKHNAKDRNSLGENFVLGIDEGPDNKLWLFTHSGISIYNSTTESFNNDIPAEMARYKIPTTQITSIKKDREGNFWFITTGKGVYCYHPKNNSTKFYSIASMLHANGVTDIAAAGKNNIWLIYKDGFMDELNTQTNKIVNRYAGIAEADHDKLQYYNLMVDNKRNVWVYSDAGPIGVYCYNPQKQSLIHFSKETPQNKLNSNVTNNIVQAEDNKIWVGTDHGGINVIDPETNQVEYLVNKEDDPKSISGNSVVLYKDDENIIWAGTFKQGISYYHKNVTQFPLIKHFVSNQKSLPYEDVDRFAEDANGNLWIGTNGGGLIYYNRATQTYTRYKHNAADPNSLTNDVVISLCIDHDRRLWVGTYFGGMDRFENGKFVHYVHNDKLAGSLSDNRVNSIMEDASQRLWVGTFNGLNIYDPKTNGFLHPKYPMRSEYTSSMLQDRAGNIWIGRDKGVDMIEKGSNTVKHYFYQAQNPNSLAANDVNNVIQDSRGLIWIGTKDGLSILNTSSQQFTNLDEGKGLPANNVLTILEDKGGKMWISTTNGLASIGLSKKSGVYQYQINKYNEFDGLQGRQFNAYAALKLKSGDIMFGGAHGFNMFNPRAVNAYAPKPKLVFTDFQLFNNSVAVGDTINGKVFLNRSITETKAVTLHHNENVFSIEFVACDFLNADKIRYEYMLEGFDKNWIVSPQDSRKATYTNLDGGDYTFKVRARNINGTHYDDEITLKITVLPPFWKTPLAYITYLLLALGFVFYLRHRGIIKIKREFEARQEKLEAERKILQEREEAQRMHELDLMKIKFFTNVSHEFRTPLSLILAPIDELIKVIDKPELQHQIVMIKRNGKRLLNLVNQLLDFRKMEFNELKLFLTQGDIVKFIREVFSSFTDVARQKQIQYIFDSEVCSYITNFDHDKIERIFFNLLSNAFKFTPSGGHISVLISLGNCPDGHEGNMLEIKVIDTGIGIAKENQDKIFERFFQNALPESLLNQGSGIGLSITKEFIKMHGGKIAVESEPEYGSCFMISLPIGVQCEQVEAVPVLEEHLHKVVEPKASSLGSAKKPTILLVEDNDDLRFYLKDNLKNNFHIIEAANGKDGWQMALALHPKLIVSDVNMPVMNGLDLCKKIKEDSRTTQIPVILLTALIEEEDQLAGLESGANDYISKPFSFEILLSKIQNLLRMQQTMKKTYEKQVEVNAMDIEVVSEDDKFLKNAFAYIELNITNPNFSVEELSRHLNLSRVSLYKKLLTLTGKTPVDCIRTIRLKRAVQLLEKSKLSIANVAYEVGFNNAAYFAKVFREEFGMLPSEYIVEMKNKEKAEAPIL
jgi:signal transduction histidine kinase/ligand-binding sensor domain-containing protein/DNA-binding response OmpR family regulator